MFFPAAGLEVAPWVPPLFAFLIAFFTSGAGVSGAFLLLPFQMSVLGFTTPAVTATNHLYNVLSIPSGVYRYVREGRMLWPLACVVIAGTVPGVLVGAIIRVRWLPDPRHFKLFAAAVLSYIGIRMLRALLSGSPTATAQDASERRFREYAYRHRKRMVAAAAKGAGLLPAVRMVRFTLRSIDYEFHGERFVIPVFGVFLLSLLVGIAGGIYGIGGGSILAPFFVSFLHLPVYTVAGAALMGTCVTSLSAVVFYLAIAPFYPEMSVAPAWSLGFLFALGGMAGMYLGARCQKYIPAKAIKWALSLIVLLTAGKYVASYFGA
jgi:uncharacterized membrane protein YfcA